MHHFIWLAWIAFVVPMNFDSLQNTPTAQSLSYIMINRTYTHAYIEAYTRAHAKEANPSSQWGENLKGIIKKFKPSRINGIEQKELALTLDACGGKNGSKIDRVLIEFLIQYNIKATLFVNARWIAANREYFLDLASNPLFEIQNHGFLHRPLSITPREIYHIKSTQSLSEILQEIQINANVISHLTGKIPRFFRSGTAYYDEISLQILRDLGYRAAGFSFSADYGATLGADRVAANLLRAKSGDIILAHMNQPQSQSAQGMIKALPKLLEQGFRFKLLGEIEQGDFIAD